MLRPLVLAGALTLAAPVAAEPAPPPGLWLRQGCLDGAQLICQYQWQDGDARGFPLMYKQVLSNRPGSEDFEFLYRCTPQPQVVRVTRATSLASLRRWTSEESLKAQCRR